MCAKKGLFNLFNLFFFKRLYKARQLKWIEQVYLI